jgi:hypothetical protein
MKTDDLVAGGAEQSWTSQGAVTVVLLANSRSRENAIGAHTSSAVTYSTDSEEGPREVNQRDSHVRRNPQTTTNVGAKVVFSTLNIANLK